jgi:predicted DNA-binding transcriptional regulator AlpA
MVMATPVEREFYSSREVEALTGLSHTGVWRAATRGDLPSIRIGKRILFPRRGIEKLIAEAVDQPRSAHNNPNERDHGRHAEAPLFAAGRAQRRANSGPG